MYGTIFKVSSNRISYRFWQLIRSCNKKIPYKFLIQIEKRKPTMNLSFDFGFNLKEAYVKIVPKEKLSSLLNNEKDQDLKRESVELVNITDTGAIIPYEDFLYRVYLPKGGEFCFPTNDHGVTLLGKIPWADTSKTASKNIYIDNVRISNIYHTNWQFPYEKKIFYKGQDNMISTLFEIHGMNYPTLFTFAMCDDIGMLLTLTETVFPKEKKRAFFAFEFNSFELQGGEDYVLKYISNGKIIDTKKSGMKM